MTRESEMFSEHEERPTDGGTPLLLAVGSMWSLIFDAMGAARRHQPATDTLRRSEDWARSARERQH
jgi:hypothetical protein